MAPERDDWVQGLRDSLSGRSGPCAPRNQLLHQERGKGGSVCLSAPWTHRQKVRSSFSMPSKLGRRFPRGGVFLCVFSFFPFFFLCSINIDEKVDFSWSSVKTWEESWLFFLFFVKTKEEGWLFSSLWRWGKKVGCYFSSRWKQRKKVGYSLSLPWRHGKKVGYFSLFLEDMGRLVTLSSIPSRHGKVSYSFLCSTKTWEG